ncbi:hypothetical protein D9V37_10510 [Nocardioides mangrovicus]|uniref:Uncharacterized protein n=1 Tax=Nocardioides mangrovicus TaxID=2478913 RepID=A0A3L8P217_9ACTN|nr:hypothetical protein [Nocardioides mangrovicus]RLV49007.1 hypothetical protein D9V37_10510 [Nocardioides mangrovicus]
MRFSQSEVDLLRDLLTARTDGGGVEVPPSILLAVLACAGGQTIRDAWGSVQDSREGDGWQVLAVCDETVVEVVANPYVDEGDGKWQEGIDAVVHRISDISSVNVVRPEGSWSPDLEAWVSEPGWVFKFRDGTVLKLWGRHVDGKWQRSLASDVGQVLHRRWLDQCS